MSRLNLSNKVKDTASYVLIGVVVFAMICGFVLFGIELTQNAQANSKIESQANEITLLLKEHSGLLAQVAIEQKTLQTASNAVTADGNYIVAWQQWAAKIIGPLCAQPSMTTGASTSCPPPPAPPA